MKKFLFIIGFMLCGIINAQSNYGIKIAGTELTSDNAGAINNTNFPNLILNEGTISYDSSTKTITLNEVNANIKPGIFIALQIFYILQN